MALVEYDPAHNNLDEVPARSSKVAAILRRKADAMANYWRSNSIVDTGYNASHTQIIEGSNPETGAKQVTFVATGRYAKWREIGSSRAGPRAPERVMLRGRPVIRDA